jgi:hypothetical protein
VKVIELFIVYLRSIPLTLLLLPILISNLLYPALFNAGSFSYIPKDTSKDIIEGGGVSTSIYDYSDDYID